MFELDLKVEGLESVRAILNVLKSVQSSATGVELYQGKRKTHYSEYGPSTNQEDTTTNAVVLNALRDQGRDFVENNVADNDKIADAFVKEIERRIKTGINRDNILSAWQKKVIKSNISYNKAVQKFAAGKRKSEPRIPKITIEKFANELASAGLKKAMLKYMDIVSERINKQISNKEFNRKLTDKYEEYKLANWGFAYPIGKRSGQLIAALNSSGPNAGKIRIVRNKNKWPL